MTHPIRVRFTVLLALAIAILFASGQAAAKPKSAPVQPPPQPNANPWAQPSWVKPVEWFQYPVKFVCGTSEGDPLRLVPGRYATAVNLFNASSAEVTVHENLALAFPPQEQGPGEISDALEVVIGPGAALQIDCEEIQNDFVFANPPPASDHLEGFLLIESNRALHVEVVYTAAGESGDVSIDVERIAERKAIPRPFFARVKICHYPPGNPDNRHTITVDASALSAHRAHGDTLGECPRHDEEDED